MEQRIKIVWIFSIASILLITCGQVYWLRNQYQYMNDEQINGFAQLIEEHIGIVEHLFGLRSTDRVILLSGLQDAIINIIDLFIIHVLILVT